MIDWRMLQLAIKDNPAVNMKCDYVTAGGRGAAIGTVEPGQVPFGGSVVILIDH